MKRQVWIIIGFAILFFVTTKDKIIFAINNPEYRSLIFDVYGLTFVIMMLAAIIVVWLTIFIQNKFRKKK